MRAKQRILVVDDERDVLEAIAFQLFVSGYEITKALSGEHMIELLKDYKPDLILIDQMMPGFTGVEAIAAIQESPRLKEIPVLLMSASPEPKSKTAKWNGFLRKPFRIDDVLAQVKTTISRSTGEQL